MGQPDFTFPRGYLSRWTRLQQGHSNGVAKYREGTRGITLDGFLHDVIRQGEPGGITLDGSHLRGYTTEASPEVEEGESPSVTHIRVAILQRHHRK